MPLTPSLRREYDPARLLETRPPLLRDINKRLVFALCCPPGAVHAGPIALSHWAGADDLGAVLAAGSDGEPLQHVLERVCDLGYAWGEGDGN